MKKVTAFLLCLCILLCCSAFADGYRLKLSPTNVTLKPGETANVSFSVTPKNLMEHTVRWESENTFIATVSASGKITAKAAGTTHIIATLESGETARVTVTVSGKAVTSLVIQDSDIELEVGESAVFTYIMNEDADDKRVHWESDDKTVATVDQNGRVTAVGGGIATITLTAVNGRTATASVYVPSEVRTIKLYPETAEIGVNATLDMDAYIFPGNARDRTLTWASSDESVAVIDENGHITGIAPGTCMIRASSVNGINAFASLTVNYLPDTVTLTPDIIVLSKEDRNASLTAEIEPENARGCNLVWASSNESVVKVSGGVLTAKGYGTATVTATAANGVSGEATVCVCEPPEAVFLDSTRYTLAADGESITLRTAFRPTDSMETGLTYATSDTKIATVDKNGVLKGVHYGSCTVTVTTPNGLTATADVLVYENADALYLGENTVTLEQYEFYTPTVFAGNGKPYRSVLAGYSSDPEVCIWVDGSVFAKAPGKARITLSNPGTTLTTTLNVTVVECFTTSSKVIALTFDNGPGEQTGEILKVLDNYGIDATFFLLGENLSARPETAALYKDTEHELGNHTYDNTGIVGAPKMAELSSDIEKTDKLIKSATGRNATLLRTSDARLPMSLFSSFLDTRRYVGRGEIICDTDPNVSADEIVKYAKEHCYDNAVLTFHEVSAETPKALEKLIPDLLRQGYRFVTVSELMIITGSTQAVFSTKP